MKSGKLNKTRLGSWFGQTATTYSSYPSIYKQLVRCKRKFRNKLTEMVITPSLPTFSIALAISSPISRSPFADIVPTFKKIER